MSKESRRGRGAGGPAGGAYFLAFIGAAIYFIQHSVGFGGFLVALLKSCVWPAYLVHAVLAFLKV